VRDEIPRGFKSAGCRLCTRARQEKVASRSHSRAIVEDLEDIRMSESLYRFYLSMGRRNEGSASGLADS
jgi:hypothetical protein